MSKTKSNRAPADHVHPVRSSGRPTAAELRAEFASTVAQLDDESRAQLLAEARAFAELEEKRWRAAGEKLRATNPEGYAAISALLWSLTGGAA